jgi:hypothetical protein
MIERNYDVAFFNGQSAGRFPFIEPRDQFITADGVYLIESFAVGSELIAQVALEVREISSTAFERG